MGASKEGDSSYTLDVRFDDFLRISWNILVGHIMSQHINLAGQGIDIIVAQVVGQVLVQVVSQVVIIQVVILSLDLAMMLILRISNCTIFEISCGCIHIDLYIILKYFYV